MTERDTGVYNSDGRWLGIGREPTAAEMQAEAERCREQRIQGLHTELDQLEREASKRRHPAGKKRIQP